TNEFGCTDSTIHDVLVDSLPVADFSYTTGCVGWETCFFDESIPNADSIFYRYWNFGDGNSSTLHNPCHIYTNPGQYEVVFVVINSNICVANTKIDTINVDYPPLAAFSASASCFNDTTYFVNETDTQGVEVQYWEWNFDDPASGVNNTSSLQTPEHLFTHEGMFNVELIVENIHGCIDTVINTILVDSLPEAHFLFPDTVAMGIVFLLVDSSLAHGSPIIIRHWDLGDGTTYSNLYQVYHSYSEPGEYEVCLAVTDYNGCSDTICQTIIVSAMPLADFDYTSDETLIANFYDESTPDTNIIDWFWDFGNPFTTDDTVSGIQNPIYYDYPTEGYYDVYLEISDKYGGTHDTTKQIYVGCAAIANFSYFDICLGDTTFFLDNSYSPVSAPIESWQWNFGDETDTVYYEQTDTITHYYDTSGVYNVELVIISNYNNNFVSDTILKEIRIYNLPSANFSSEGVCLGTETEFIDSSYSDIGNHITSWFWDFDDGYTGTVQNPIHKYNDVGEYNVFLEITTVHGCIDTITNKSYVSFAPDIPFHVENNCLNSPAYFIPDYDSTEIEITSWFWDFGDPYDDTTSTEPSPEHTYTRIMNYEVTMVASTYGCPKENKMSILVYPIPYSSFTLIPDYGDVQGRTKFTNQSIYADHYLWDFGNGNTSEVINPIEVYEEDSTYIVTLVSYNEYNCSDTSRLELLVFFNGLYFPTAFSPNNPNSEISRFTPKGVNLDEYQVQVFDLRGNLLWESDILDDTGSPVESWDGYYEGRLMPEGMYIWKASGLFKDGSVWKGSTFQSESPQTQGTVTLVR
ncbi:MAG: PKD domain-containing protein, partial [Bacteroidetes bacterium]|nr:PKD domain-containing protein [Bacteroidota bacterium]